MIAEGTFYETGDHPADVLRVPPFPGRWASVLPESGEGVYQPAAISLSASYPVASDRTTAMNFILAAAQSASIPGDIRANVARHVQFGERAADHGVHLLIFPELSLTGYELGLARACAIRPENPELHPLRDFAARSGITLVAGAPIPSEQNQLHIAALAFSPDGAVSIYTKQHVHQSEQHVFTPGSGGAPLSIHGATVALAICFDATHPPHAAAAASCGADVYAASVMIDDKGYARKSALLQGYAREHGMTVLMANYSGVTGGDVSAGRSAIWSDTGDHLAVVAGNEEALVIGIRHADQWSARVEYVTPSSCSAVP